jgi:hypothetical protein
MTLEAILFLGFAFSGANLMQSNLISPYLGQVSGMLFFHVLGLIGWLAYWWIGRKDTDAGERKRFWFALAFVGIFVGTAFVRQIDLRGSSGQPFGIHDGAVHVEVATEKLLDGVNPYSADYRGSNYEILNPRIPEGPATNIVWSHFIYPPGVFLLQVPWHIKATAFGFVPDVRWIFLVALGGVAWVAIALQRTWSMRTRMLLLTAGNPLLWLYVVAGYNDILVVAALAITALMLARKKWWLSGLFFGLAIGLKQSVWMTLPIFAWYVWRLWAHDRRAGKQIIKGVAVSVGVIFLPFLIWDAGALYDDIVRYASGAIAYSYPISGATLLQYLRVWGLIDSPWTVLPTHLFQLAVGVPVAIGLCRWLGKKPRPEDWLTATTILITAVLLVSRYNNNNYLSAIVGLAVIAYAFRTSRPA